ncbi:DUF1579 domain-containing protein [candidate division KSB1 bacterium]|nr:DUF1579 domain-containing protein [candidate division KSB1 bacterium]NIR70555.1 DUF1579 domain-containing protein [candidate division KSB1 bacterium]NIS27701.1 DUF1579 domain-containing protein [candidate division KSB1 bacterium]NIT70475.1 DUF1579 domain-containing protein [candidate division KSB1 bacterium]NIU28354.1 DUF1579 domain-containing protein [candidate division KSB1 bacterium]
MMRKLVVILLALMVCVAMPLMAQEKEEMAKGEMEEYAPPPPLDDKWCNFLIGEWEGTSEGPMGKSQERETIEMGLNGQFLFRRAEGKMENGMSYVGMGAMTIDPESGKYVGYWIDSHRGMYEGTGQAEDGKLTMSWEGDMGSYTQVIEKVGDDKIAGTWTYTPADGEPMKGTYEMTRKKKMNEK